MKDVSLLLASGSLEQTGVTDAATVGGKAAGLLALPPQWYPPFVVLTPDFCRNWAERHRADVCLLGLSIGEQRTLERLLAQGRRSANPQGILVRSNDSRETQQSRGRFRSERAAANVADLARAINVVLRQAERPDALMVQLLVAPGILGHLSNERRVSEDRRSGLVEYEEGPNLRQVKIRASSVACSENLAAGDMQSVLSVLRGVSNFLQQSSPSRFHVEWIWDARRVWIVQMEEAEPPSGHSANDYLKTSEAWTPSLPELTLLRLAGPADEDRWLKLRRHRVFRSARLSVPDTFLLSVDDARQALNSPQIDYLRSDIAQLLERPLVVRMSGTQEHDLLPTSDPLTSVNAVVQFLADRVADTPIAEDQMAFLFGQLVPARASAMVQAFPDSPQVKVDTTWGFPDGLLHYAHDTYFVRPERTQPRRRFKPMGIFVEPGNGWTSLAVAPPFDWAPVLDDAEAQAAARWGRLVAQQEGMECQLMVLARIGNRRGSEAMLPWCYTTHESAVVTNPLTFSPLDKSASVVTTREDLAHLGDMPRTRIRLTPVRELIRDTNFLLEVGRVAADLERAGFDGGRYLTQLAISFSSCSA